MDFVSLTLTIIFSHVGYYSEECSYLCDDLILSGNNSAALLDFNKYLCSYIHMKGIGILEYFLSIEIGRNPKGIFQCQHEYTLDIISKLVILVLNRCFFSWSLTIDLRGLLDRS